MTFRNFGRIFSLVFVLYGCAQQRPLSGGEKDITPPKITFASPDNFSTNFQGKKITLEFDEFVRLNNISKELIVSPPLSKNPEVNLRGKTVTISWEDTLLENTTYNFYFSEGIVDNNEGNVLDSNRFVFSTGDYLDSLEVSGKVLDAFTLKPLEGVWGMLLSDTTDSNIYLNRPLYFGRSDERGDFKIPFIAPGQYEMIALADENFNLLYNPPEEKIGFLNTAVVLENAADSSKKPALMMFSEKAADQYLVSSNIIDKNRLLLVAASAFDSIEVRVLPEALKPNWTMNRLSADSIEYWFDSTLVSDTLGVIIALDKSFKDTLNLKNQTPKSRRSKKEETSESIKLTSSFRTGAQPYFRPLRFGLATPIGSVDSNKITLVQTPDSASIPFTLSTTFNSFSLQVDLEAGQNYKVLLLPGAVIDRYGKTIDTLKLSFRTTTPEDYGELQLKIQNLPESPLLLELLDENDKLKRTLPLQGVNNIPIKNIAAGKYKLKVIVDSNADGAWTSGNYRLRHQPEKVFYYSELITIRGNWISEIIWSLRPTIVD